MASGLRSRNNRKPETPTHDEKAQLYRQLLATSCRLNSSDKVHDLNAEAEPVKLKQDLALWGSPEVIKAYAELERRARLAAPQGDGVEPLLQTLVMEMRKDLGQSTSAINPADFLDLL